MVLNMFWYLYGISPLEGLSRKIIQENYPFKIISSMAERQLKWSVVSVDFMLGGLKSGIGW